MSNLDSTNVILTVLTATSVAQLLLVLGFIVWIGRRVAALQQTVALFQSNHLASLADRTKEAIADLHVIANRADRVGAELERTARGAQAILHAVEQEVTRTTRGVHQALEVVSNGYRQINAVGAGLRDGVRELLSTRRQRLDRRVDEDAEARFEAGA